MKKSVWILVGVGLVILGNSWAWAQKIKVGYLPVSGLTVIYAHEKGFWKEEGLTIEMELLRGGPAIVEAMVAGSLQAGGIGYMPMLYAANAGLPFYYLATDGIGIQGTPHRANAISVRKDSPIRSLKDLKGKTLAMHQAGTVQEVYAITALKLAGLDPKKDISIVFIPFPEQGVALEKGMIDAAMPGAPFTTFQVMRNNARILHWQEEVFPYMHISGLAIRRDFAEKNPEATKRLAKGFVKTGRWINDNLDEARKLITKVLKLPEDVGAKQDMQYWLRNGFHIMPSVWDIYYAMVEFKLLPGFKEPEKVINEYFVEPTLKYTVSAVKELGEQPDPLRDQALKMKLYFLKKPTVEYLGPWEKK